ncbi:hypothetical protein ACP4OV_005763 [Aristida adscensionis]
MMKLNAVAPPALVAPTLLVIAAQLQAAAADGYSTPGYGNNYSPVEVIVRQEVEKALAYDRSKGPALIRLFFHDCWIYGCDASVLLDPSPLNPSPEKVSGANIGLRGFDVIDAIKDKLEAAYPGMVSCADILAFAARDATRYLSVRHIDYNLTSGRKDGVVSRSRDAENTLPASTFSFAQLKENFATKNFTVEELVVLSGAHSIGVAHYPSFKDRLEVANDVRDEDVVFKLVAGYGAAAAANDGRYLNNTYYHNSLNNKVLFRSDWELTQDTFAKGKLVEYKEKPDKWDSDFAEAMVKLSELRADGRYSEIRKK